MNRRHILLSALAAGAARAGGGRQRERGGRMLRVEVTARDGARLFTASSGPAAGGDGLPKGAYDTWRSSSPETSRRLSEGIASAELKVYPGASHGISVTTWRRWTATLKPSSAAEVAAWASRP